MAEIEIIKGADNGNPPDTLRQMYPKVNRNFQRLNSEVGTNKTDADNKLEAHKNSTSAHTAQNITYSGDIIGASNVKQALDNTKQTIDDLILGSGDSGPEVAAARNGYATLGDRINASDSQLYDLTRISDYLFGYEYLVHYHTKVMLKQQTTAIFGGDSTSDDGPWITNKDYLLKNVARTILDRRGANRVNTVASGHSGMRTVQWESTYLAEDLAQNPDLYILRWGLNDAAHIPKSERLQVFTDALRGGLSTIRASKTANELSVVLMMPNSTNDPANGRDAAWFDEIYPVIKQAAKDYQCCFVDTYHFLLDSTNVTWQDDMLNDGVHIHPLDIGNAWIVGLLEDVLVPPALQDFGFINPLSTTKTRSVSEAPSTYPEGVSIYRTDHTFPYNGMVITFSSADGVLFQINSGLFAQNFERVATRRGLRVVGVPNGIGDDSWSSWSGQNQPQNLVLENGFTANALGAPTYYLDSSGIIHLSGVVSIPSGVTQNTVITTLPQGCRPHQSGFHPTTDDIGFARLHIWGDGTIRNSLGSGTQWISLDGISFPVK